MAGKLIMTKGLPGSGKSTWAEGRKALDKTTIVVCKDDIRANMRPGWAWSPKAEEEIIRQRDFAITVGLQKGLTVISSDTNLAPKHETRLRDLARKYKAEFVIQDFTNVPVEVCIERDSTREEPVGEAVILGMSKQYDVPKDVMSTYVPDETKPRALIVDVDGTLALMNGRGPYETEKAASDLPNVNVVEIVQLYEALGYKIVVMSGREDKYRGLTEDWLVAQSIVADSIHMRKTGDFRNDAKVKYELFNTYVRPHYNVRFVLDDRDRVVQMWRSVGLTCLQVAPGNF